LIFDFCVEGISEAKTDDAKSSNPICDAAAIAAVEAKKFLRLIVNGQTDLNFVLLDMYKSPYFNFHI